MQPGLREVTIYTDGCCLGNPGPGGYGVVLLDGSQRRELSAGFRLTTNNRMELMAAIVSLEALTVPCRVTLFTDSEYLIYGASQARQWRRDGWRLDPPKTRKAANCDLWKRLLALCDHHDVTFNWVRGHTNITENERCDVLANLAAEQSDLPVDAVYEEENPSLKPFVRLDDVCVNLAGADRKITAEGQPCRKCGEPVIRRTPRKRRKPGQTYYFKYYFHCPRCRTMYLVEEAKRYFEET